MGERKFIDISKGVADYLGLTGEALYDEVRRMLNTGCVPHDIEVIQKGTRKRLQLRVLSQSGESL